MDEQQTNPRARPCHVVETKDQVRRVDFAFVSRWGALCATVHTYPIEAACFSELIPDRSCQA